MSDDEDLIGTVLDGRWEVLQLLGMGGMGKVYRARHLHLGTDVAIKVLTDPSDVARFYRESELIGRLNHDHIIRVQDTGKTPSGDDFFVMEYLRGPNLRMLLHDNGPLPWARTRGIVLQVCDALSAIHSSGVIHRDLKLQNIVLDPRRGCPDFVKLLDFGVAKSLIDNRQPLTQHGIVLGTLPYMAPEYMLGYPPDGRVDIYALGVITFELLTGRLPSPNSATNLTLLQSQSVPAGAQEVVVRAMMRDPAQRFGDAEAFAAALAASPDEARSSLDESTTTRFVGLTNSVSNGYIDAGRTTWSPPGGLHAPVPTVIKVDDNNRPPPAPAAPEPVIPTLARPLPPFESSVEPDDAIEPVGPAERTPMARVPGSAGTTSLLVEAPVAAPTDPAASEPQRPSIPPLMSQVPLLGAIPKRPEGPHDGAQAELPAKPPAATAALARPSAAPKPARRALYMLIVGFSAVLVYTLIPDPSPPKPAIGEPRGSGTGLRDVSTNAAQPPGGAAGGGTDPDATAGGTDPDATATGGPATGGQVADATATGGQVADATAIGGQVADATATGAPTPDPAVGDTAGGGQVADATASGDHSPPPPKPQQMTGKRSYDNKLPKMKSAVKECPIIEDADALTLSIIIDGQSGKAKVKVLGPKLVIDEPGADCAVDGIEKIKFEHFKGTYSPPPALFNLKKQKARSSPASPRGGAARR